MTLQQYIQILQRARDNATFDDFMGWLEQSPDFMELSVIEIEINFMLYSVAVESYCQAAHDYTDEY